MDTRRQYALLRRDNPKTNADLIAVATRDQQEVIVVQSPYEELEGQFSPDGKWVAFVSTDSGRPEVFMQSFPDGRSRTQISTAGGTQVRWSNDGKEIFFLAPDGKLMAARVGLRIEAGITSAIDLAHAACPDRRDDLVRTETRAGLEWHATVRPAPARECCPQVPAG